MSEKRKIYIRDTAGNSYEAEVNHRSTIGNIATDFFEAMEWPQQDDSGRGQRAVVEYLDPDTGKYIRLRPDQTLAEADIPDGAILSIYPESIAGPGTKPHVEYLTEQTLLTTQKFSQDFFASSQLSKAALNIPDYTATNNQPQRKKMPVTLISLFHLPPYNHQQVELDENMSLADNLALLQKNIKPDINPVGLILCKENKQILNRYTTIAQQQIKPNQTLLWAEANEILDLHEHTDLLAQVPNEVLQQGKKYTLYYINNLSNISNGGPQKLAECKLAFVGSGDVGKTSLISMLKYNTYDKESQKTDGIDISDWQVWHTDGSPIKIHIWDFGGQEIKHAAHTFFLTERTVYVLVVMPRREDAHTQMDLEHWLNSINTYAPQCPIVIAFNKCDEHRFKVDKMVLRREYPQIVGIIETSCKDKLGIAELERLITMAITDMPHINDLIPADFVKIKDAIVAHSENYFPYGHYKTICKAINVQFSDMEMSGLARLLNDLGILLNIHNDRLLEDTHVLKPEWITEGVYQILKSNTLLQNNGKITEQALIDLLPKKLYPDVADCKVLLNLLLHFKFCYCTNAHKKDTCIYYFPVHFAATNPTYEQPNGTVPLCFFYEYKYMPMEVLYYFIVDNHYRIEQYWSSGCVYAWPDDNLKAVITADKKNKRLYLQIMGSGNKRLLLEAIREQIYRLHASIPNITIAEFIMDYVTNTIPINFNDLKQYEKVGKMLWYEPKLNMDLSVKKLLYGTEDEPIANCDEILSFLKGGDIDEALAELNKLIQQENIPIDLENDSILLQGQYHSLKNDKSLLPPESFIQLRANSLNNLISLVQKLKKQINK